MNKSKTGSHAERLVIRIDRVLRLSWKQCTRFFVGAVWILGGLQAEATNSSLPDGAMRGLLLFQLVVALMLICSVLWLFAGWKRGGTEYPSWPEYPVFSFLVLLWLTLGLGQLFHGNFMSDVLVSGKGCVHGYLWPAPWVEHPIGRTHVFRTPANWQVHPADQTSGIQGYLLMDHAHGLYLSVTVGPIESANGNPAPEVPSAVRRIEGLLNLRLAHAEANPEVTGKQARILPSTNPAVADITLTTETVTCRSRLFAIVYANPKPWGTTATQPQPNGQRSKRPQQWAEVCVWAPPAVFEQHRDTLDRILDTLAQSTRFRYGRIRTTVR